MFYYPHNIGDFNNATRYLTRVERALYRDAIELYYETELPLISDLEQLERRLMARTEEEKQGLKNILREFFVRTDDGYRQNRCDEEIAKYRANRSNKAKAGIASAEAKKNRAATEQQHNSTRVEQVSNELKNLGTKELRNLETKELNSKTETESKPLAASPRVSKQDDPIFEEAWAAYPKRPNNSKTAALKAWTARVKNGVDPADMILGVKRYAKYCEAMRTEPNFIKQAATFFGPDQHYLNDFDAKPSTGKAGMSPETKEFFNTNYDRTEANERQRASAIARGLDYDNITEEDMKF
jgi:uncharacterized protein YdaU (DUF1376 family)